VKVQKSIEVKESAQWETCAGATGSVSQNSDTKFTFGLYIYTRPLIWLINYNSRILNTQLFLYKFTFD